MHFEKGIDVDELEQCGLPVVTGTRSLAPHPAYLEGGFDLRYCPALHQFLRLGRLQRV
jgi:hypothetical protein